MRKIAAVFDTSFGHRLPALADDHHVWIVDSEANRPWIRKSWGAGRSDPSESGVTSFIALPEEVPEAQLVRILDTMADHHGPGMQNPPWLELHVYGVRPGPKVRDALAEFGFVRVHATDDGFAAYREES